MIRLTPEHFASARWWELGNHATEPLTESWRQTHYASQAAAEAGKLFAVTCDDDSHTNLEWSDGGGILDGFFAGERIETSSGVFRCALRVNDLHLFLITPSGEAIAELPLPGKTLEEALKWVHLKGMDAGGMVRQASVPAPDLPEHPLGSGAAFAEPSQFGQVELIRLYANTDAALTAISEAIPGFTRARTWPHHFDHAALLEVTKDGDAATQTVGVGLAVPDSLSAAGYWYVSPWSRIDAAKPDHRPELPHGRWIEREGSVPMAVLDLSALHGLESESEQRDIFQAFAAHAFNASLEILTDGA